MKKIAIIAGSLRKDSYAKKIARVVNELMPEGFEGKIIDLEGLNFYNQDWDTEEYTDESYLKFWDELDDISGVVFVTPEYNRSTTPVMKNAIDVGSRAKGGSKWSNLPAAVISHSPGRLGGFGANHHVRQALVYFNMQVVQQPEAYISFSYDAFDDEGNMTNEDIKSLLKAVVKGVTRLVEK